MLLQKGHAGQDVAREVGAALEALATVATKAWVPPAGTTLLIGERLTATSGTALTVIVADAVLLGSAWLAATT